MFSSSSHQASLKKTDGDTGASSIEANSSNNSHLQHYQQSSGAAVRSNTAAAAAASRNNNSSIASARETDPLLQARQGGSNPPDLFGFKGIPSAPSSSIRVRRSSKSPVQTASASMLPSSHLINHNSNNSIVNNSIGINNQQQQQLTHDDLPMTLTHGYEAIEEAVVSPRTRQGQHLPLAAAMGGGGGDDGNGSNMFNSTSASQQQQQQNHPQHSRMYRSQLPSNPPPPPQYPPGREPLSPNSSQRSSSGGTGTTASYSGHHQQQQAPILEIPEEIYIVRKAALQVLKPLTKTWVVISVGFALTVLFGMARWTRLMPGLPFWFILLPCWSSHVGLLCLHILSAQALSAFIAEANESRQRSDSRDHLNRTEYLPLLQRSLKFGLKTGLLSFFIFIFEILIYIRLAKGTISLTAALIPLWILVAGSIIDGLICKTQHILRVLCWVLTFSAMVLLVMKVDYHHDTIRWRVVVSPVVAVLSIASGTLIYIVYGHQVGYYRLTESQLTAGNLYSLAALICMVLMVMIGEVIPLSRPVEVETRLIVVILAPLVVCLVGMGAWVVSRDEFARLLLYGGQSAVHPMKLRWEAKGWTCVQGKGVVIIPMFGEVTFQPLERKPNERMVELLVCCSGTCYPYEEEDEETVHLTEDLAYHPYLDPLHSRSAYHVYRL